MKSLSDEDLMNKVRGGNEQAFEEIYHRFSVPLLRYFYRMLWQDKNKSEDFLHDLFIKLLEKSGQFDSHKKFSTWLYAIAHNMCKNEYRKQAFRTSVQNHFNGHHRIEESITIKLDKDSFQKALDEVLKEEDEENRTIFILRHELEMTFAEIGEIVHCPDGTVKSRLFNLKKKLASALEHYKVVLEK
jgi:RNA polymerase sigma-70 factor (ECF subfamily)